MIPDLMAVVWFVCKPVHGAMQCSPTTNLKIGVFCVSVGLIGLGFVAASRGAGR